jgi:hypothetical protein
MGLIFGYDTVISGGVTSMEPVLQVEAEHMLKTVRN